LDVGLVRTTVGNRVFAALKGANDGGIFVPHSHNRFPGFKKEEDKEKYDAKVHRNRIFGVHVD
jgi:large subunit ribosomal protein L5e